MKEQIVDYVSTADELVRRIYRQIQDHPEIMQMTSAWELFNIRGFNVNDLQPSAFQAGWALRQAQIKWTSKK